MIFISPEEIKMINKEITGDLIIIKDPIDSYLASLPYYETVEEKISSIVKNIIKNHYFLDGNKRTAFATFQILCNLNGIELENKNWTKIFLDLAKTNYSIDKIVSILFN